MRKSKLLTVLVAAAIGVSMVGCGSSGGSSSSGSSGSSSGRNRIDSCNYNNTWKAWI